MNEQSQSNQTTWPLIAAGLTALLMIGAIALIVLDILDIADGRTIEEAASPSLTIPLVLGALLLLATGWTYWLSKQFGIRHIGTVIAAMVAVVLLVLTPFSAWQVLGGNREVTVVSMTCDAESLRDAGSPVLANCEDDAVETIVLMEGVQTQEQWVPTTETGNLTREFTDLPGGNWETMLVVDGPPDTVAVAAIGERGDELVRLGQFRPYLDTESQRIRWSVKAPINDDVSTVRILFYLSANPVVESASIRFDVRECPSQTIRSFNAADCSPLGSSSAFVTEKSPTETRTWRHPQVSKEGSETVVGNLEARTYVLEPDYTTIQSVTQSTDVLIIPSAMEQVEANSVSVPGESAFDVVVEDNTGTLTYILYVFPTGPTYA